LVDRLLGRELVAPKRLCARKLVVRERNTCLRRLQLGVCLRKLDFVWARVDDEKKIAFVDDLAIVCTENLIRVDDVMESPKLAE
jgi:hypothetical protein